jgi:hypothetical protein
MSGPHTDPPPRSSIKPRLVGVFLLALGFLISALIGPCVAMEDKSLSVLGIFLSTLWLAGAPIIAGVIMIFRKWD